MLRLRPGRAPTRAVVDALWLAPKLPIAVGLPADYSAGRVAQRSSRRKGVSSAAGARAERANSAIATMVARNGSIRNSW